MSVLADMSNAERVAWMNFHGPALSVARLEFEQAAERYAALLTQSTGALERQADAEKVASDIMDRADGLLADELKEYFGI